MNHLCRVTSVALCVLLASTADAAPAPLPKPERTSEHRLLAALRARGVIVLRIDAGEWVGKRRGVHVLLGSSDFVEHGKTRLVLVPSEGGSRLAILRDLWKVVTSMGIESLEMRPIALGRRAGGSMLTTRATLVALSAAVLASAAQAAPAPLAKPERHPPSPGTLFANFKAEGYSHLQRLEHGSAPSVYVVEVLWPVQDRSGRFLVVPMIHTLTLPGRNVREELRRFLDETRKRLQDVARWSLA